MCACNCMPQMMKLGLVIYTFSIRIRNICDSQWKWQVYKGSIRSAMQWINSWEKLLLYNSIMSKWCQSLDDKNVCSVCSLSVKFNMDLSFSEMRNLHSIKLKKKSINTQTKKGRNFENSWKFPRNFQFR